MRVVSASDLPPPKLANPKQAAQELGANYASQAEQQSLDKSQIVYHVCSHRRIEGLFAARAPRGRLQSWRVERNLRHDGEFFI
jgi:hypothetical protein